MCPTTNNPQKSKQQRLQCRPTSAPAATQNVTYTVSQKNRLGCLDAQAKTPDKIGSQKKIQGGRSKDGLRLRREPSRETKTLGQGAIDSGREPKLERCTPKPPLSSQSCGGVCCLWSKRDRWKILHPPRSSHCVGTIKASQWSAVIHHRLRVHSHISAPDPASQRNGSCAPKCVPAIIPIRTSLRDLPCSAKSQLETPCSG